MMTQVPSSDHTEDCPRYEDQEMFTPCMIGQLEAHFLKMMVQLTDAKRILDVGTFTGPPIHPPVHPSIHPSIHSLVCLLVHFVHSLIIFFANVEACYSNCNFLCFLEG